MEVFYDLAGNRTMWMRQPAESGAVSETHYYTYDEANQLQQLMKVERSGDPLQTVYQGCAYFEHDDSGNMTQWARLDETDSVVEASYYVWDDENQLTDIKRLVGSDSAFEYDGNYQRTEQVHGGSTNRYHWDGLNVILEKDETDTTTKSHVHGPAPVEGIGTELRVREEGATPKDLWMQRDAVGSTRMLTDEGSPVDKGAEYDVDAWGKASKTSGAENTPFVFGGKESLTDSPDADLIYFGLRCACRDPRSPESRGDESLGTAGPAREVAVGVLAFSGRHAYCKPNARGHYVRIEGQSADGRGEALTDPPPRVTVVGVVQTRVGPPCMAAWRQAREATRQAVGRAWPLPSTCSTRGAPYSACM